MIKPTDQNCLRLLKHKGLYPLKVLVGQDGKAMPYNPALVKTTKDTFYLAYQVVPNGDRTFQPEGELFACLQDCACIALDSVWFAKKTSKAEDEVFAPPANEREMTDEEWNNLDTGVSQDLSHYQWD